jgi:ribosome-binding protein aMBF1 (putative translation factor)
MKNKEDNFLSDIKKLFKKYPTSFNYIQICEDLKALRKTKKISTSSLAQMIRYKKTLIEKYEKYEYEADIYFIMAYGKAVGLTIKVIKEENK